MKTGVEGVQALFQVQTVRLSSMSRGGGGMKEIATGTGTLKPIAGAEGGPAQSLAMLTQIGKGIDRVVGNLVNLSNLTAAIHNRIGEAYTGLQATIIENRPGGMLLAIYEVILEAYKGMAVGFNSIISSIQKMEHGISTAFSPMVPELLNVRIPIEKLTNAATHPGSVYTHVDKIDDSAIPNSLKPSQGGGGKGGGGLGIGSLVKGIGIFSFALTAFGAALNPGAIVQLGMAFRDVAATIGVAFEPAIHVITEGMRQVAAQILPLFVSLRPVITQLVQSFVRMLAPAARIAANYLMMVVPVLQILTSILDGFTTVWTYMSTVFITFQDMLLEFISSLLGNVGFGDAMNNVTKTLQYVGQQLILVIASIAKRLGASGFLGGLIKNFQNLITAPKTGGATAGGETSTKSLESIVKSMAESAGKAGGYAGPSPEDQQKERDEERKRLAEETLTALKEIQKKGETDTLLPELLDLVKMVVQGINGSKDAINWIKDFFKNFAKNPKTSFDQGYNASKSGKKTRVAGDSLVDELIADLGYSAGKVF
jgi:hypothetical protein